MYDNHFSSKRSECYSNIAKWFKDVNNQRVDFILRNINNDIDYLSIEEKPSLKGVKSDVKKGKILQQCMLKLWTKCFQTPTIMSQFEAITGQWNGLKLNIYRIRYVSRIKKVRFLFASSKLICRIHLHINKYATSNHIFIALEKYRLFIAIKKKRVERVYITVLTCEWVCVCAWNKNYTMQKYIIYE